MAIVKCLRALGERIGMNRVSLDACSWTKSTGRLPYYGGKPYLTRSEHVESAIQPNTARPIMGDRYYGTHEGWL